MLTASPLNLTVTTIIYCKLWHNPIENIGNHTKRARNKDALP